MQVDFIRVPAKSGAEIARELGISRQSVSQALKRGVKKMYLSLINHPNVEGPWDVVRGMVEFFGIDEETDLQQFIRLFPPDIQKEIQEDARTRFFRHQ